jgi:DTW domain-containing protein
VSAEAALPAEPRAICTRCRRPESVCYCRHLCAIETRTRVVLLQHPRESDVAIGTARMAHLCLPNSELHVGVHFDGTEALRRIKSASTGPAALLYPGPGAIDVMTHPPAGPVTLVVVDGTWWQARKLLRVNPELAALPRYAFSPPSPSTWTSASIVET